MENSVKWGDKDVFVHYISLNEDYVLAGHTSEKAGLFKVPVGELNLKGKKLDAYLLVQVEKRSL
jgi:hypothetical protein